MAAEPGKALLTNVLKETKLVAPKKPTKDDIAKRIKARRSKLEVSSSFVTETPEKELRDEAARDLQEEAQAEYEHGRSVLLTLLNQLIPRPVTELEEAVKVLGDQYMDEDRKSTHEDLHRHVGALYSVHKEMESGEANYSEFRFCHFKAKLTNSNAPGAIRIKPDRISRLPYLFSATLQANVSLTEDAVHSSKTQGVFKSLAFEEDHALAPEYIRKHIEQCRQKAPYGERDLERLDPRLRQVVLPHPEGYRCLVPLHSGSVQRALMRQYYNIEWDDRRFTYVYSLQNGIGGANFQNASVLKEVTSALWFSPPKNYDPEAQRIYRIFHVGFSPRINHLDLERYAKYVSPGGAWRDDRVSELAIDLHLKNGLGAILDDLFRQLDTHEAACKDRRDIVESVLEQNSEKRPRTALDAALLRGRVTTKEFPELAQILLEKLKRVSSRRKERVLRVTDILEELIIAALNRKGKSRYRSV